MVYVSVKAVTSIKSLYSLLFVFVVQILTVSISVSMGDCLVQMKNVQHNSPTNPLNKATAEQIVQIDIGRLHNVFDNPIFRPDCYSVTNYQLISQASSILLAAKHQNFSVPFSGVLSYQVFLDSEGDTLAIAQIINTPGSIVLLSKNIMPPENQSDNFFIITSREYCKLILTIMREQCPDRLNQIGRFHGKSIEDLILYVCNDPEYPADENQAENGDEITPKNPTQVEPGAR